MQYISSSHLLQPALAFTIAFALAMIVWACRGRRVDAHPICRRCGFDLFGKPKATLFCGECGADITRRRAIRIGRRERRRGWLRMTVPVLLACLAWEAQLGWKAAKSTDWNRHKPAWWMVRQAHTGIPRTRDVALAELARRIAAGTLSQKRQDELLDEAFALQADLSRPWLPGWGTLVESARQRGQLSDQRWQAYLFHGFQLNLAPVKPIYRRGDTLQFIVSHGPDRLGAMQIASDGCDVGIYVAGESGDEQVIIGGYPSKATIAPTSGDEHWMPHMKSARPLCFEVDASPGGITPPLPIRIASRCPEAKVPLSDGPQTAQVALIIVPIWHEYDKYWKRGRDPHEPPLVCPAPRTINLSCVFRLVRGPAFRTGKGAMMKRG